MIVPCKIDWGMGIVEQFQKCGGILTHTRCLYLPQFSNYKYVFFVFFDNDHSLVLVRIIDFNSRILTCTELKGHCGLF